MSDHNQIIGFHHIAIRAQDFQETINFYTQVLGFTLGHSWSLPQFNLKNAAMLKSPDGNGFVEVYDNNADIPAQGRKRKPGEEFVQTALLHICLSVHDAEKAYHDAISGGAKPCIEPMTLTLGSALFTVKNSLVYSPNGEVIEFLEKKGSEFL